MLYPSVRICYLVLQWQALIWLQFPYFSPTTNSRRGTVYLSPPPPAIFSLGNTALCSPPPLILGRFTCSPTTLRVATRRYLKELYGVDDVYSLKASDLTVLEPSAFFPARSYETGKLWTATPKSFLQVTNFLRVISRTSLV